MKCKQQMKILWYNHNKDKRYNVKWVFEKIFLDNKGKKGNKIPSCSAWKNLTGNLSKKDC